MRCPAAHPGSVHELHGDMQPSQMAVLDRIRLTGSLPSVSSGPYWKGGVALASFALVGASDMNAEAFLSLEREGAFDEVIAVDGGYDHLRRLGIDAGLAIGDFDSLGFVPEGIRIEEFPAHKDESDMELALEAANAMGCDRAYVFGALGGRLDHTLANLQVLSKASEQGMNVTAIGMREEVRFLTGPSEVVLEGRVGGTVSVFAMSDIVEGLVERGLEWELEGEELCNRTSLGLSNVIRSPIASISVGAGTIAVVSSLG